jgi:hypothetical protein
MYFTDTTNYVVMSQHQNVRRSHHINTDNSSDERLEQFKYFVTTISDENYIVLDIKSGLSSGNNFNHMVDAFSFSLCYPNI